MRGLRSGAAVLTLLAGLLSGCGDDVGNSSTGVGQQDRPVGTPTSTSEFWALVGAGVASIEDAEVVHRSVTDGVEMVSDGSLARAGGDAWALATTMSVDGRPVLELVSVRDTVYTIVPGADRCSVASVEDALAGTGLDPDALNPVVSVERFAATIEAVTEVGPAEVDGVAVTHYRVVTDDPESGEEVLQDVWLDAEGRAVRIAYEVETAGRSTSVETTMGNFNAGIGIVAPDVDAPALHHGG